MSFWKILIMWKRSFNILGPCMRTVGATKNLLRGLVPTTSSVETFNSLPHTYSGGCSLPWEVETCMNALCNEDDWYNTIKIKTSFILNFLVSKLVFATNTLNQLWRAKSIKRDIKSFSNHEFHACNSWISISIWNTLI